MINSGPRLTKRCWVIDHRCEWYGEVQFPEIPPTSPEASFLSNIIGCPCLASLISSLQNYRWMDYWLFLWSWHLPSKLLPFQLFPHFSMSNSYNIPFVPQRKEWLCIFDWILNDSGDTINKCRGDWGTFNEGIREPKPEPLAHFYIKKIKTIKNYKSSDVM